MNFKEFLAAGKEQLRSAGIDPIDAEHLMAYALGISRMDLHNPVILEDRLAGLWRSDYLGRDILEVTRCACCS
jgi:release factor glutamine methyltransferase